MLFSVGHHVGRERVDHRVAFDRTTLLFAVPGAHTERESGRAVVQHQTSLHAIRWQATFRRVDSLHGLGQTFRLSVVSERSLGQLRRMEGHLHRKQQSGSNIIR